MPEQYGAKIMGFATPPTRRKLMNAPMPGGHHPRTVPRTPYTNQVPTGMVLEGNIMGQSFNPEDTVSVEFSHNGYFLETLLPRVVNGRRLTDEQAIERYKQTGEHLGQFETPDDALSFAGKMKRR